ncbi:MAG: hypothetical protein HFJ55_05120 [Clostridia bacterium]|nr:hypothetical protein [Clostridia bacterium]
MQKFKISGSCYVNDKIIGTTVAKKITVDILNEGQYNLDDKEISVKTGIKIGNSIEYIPMGSFIIDKPETQEVNIKTQFTGYDYMIKFNKKYIDRVTYPCKAIVLLEDVCNQAGVKCGSTEFANSDYMILGNPFTNNENCRTVLSNIAQLAGGFATIGRDNKLYISTLKTGSNLLKVKDVHFMKVKDLNLMQTNMLVGKDTLVEEQINSNNYFEFSKNNKYGKVNSLVVGLSGIEGENSSREDTESIAKEGLTEVKVEDNYFLINKNEREKIIEPLWNVLKGLEYVPFEITYYGYPYLDLGDMLCVEDIKDKQYYTYVLDYMFEYAGDYNGELKAEAITKTQTAYKNTEDIKTKFRRTERTINKIDGKIKDIIEEQTETSNKITKHEQDIDSIKDEVSSIQEITAKVAGLTTLTLESCMEGILLELHIFGNNTVFDCLYPSNNLFPSNTLYPKGDSRIRVINYTDESEEGVETGIYELGVNSVLRQNGKICDEYILKDGKAKIIRRINSDGTVKTKEETVDLGEFSIPLSAGKNKIQIQNYVANLSAEYVLQTKFTNIFTSKIEMKSQLELRDESINIELSKKTDNNKIIASINMSTEKDKNGSEMRLRADKIDISGKAVNFTTQIGLDHIYTKEDADRALDIYIDDVTPTQRELELYDIDGNGVVDVFDAADINDAVCNNNGEIKGSFSINAYSTQKAILFKDSYGNETSYIGLFGAKFRKLQSDNIQCTDIEVGEDKTSIRELIKKVNDMQKEIKTLKGGK